MGTDGATELAASEGRDQTPTLVSAEIVNTDAVPVTDPAASTATAITIAGHPKASRLIRRAREMGGVAGFAAGAWMSAPTHTLAATLLRAIIAGLACQTIVWAAAVVLCKHLITAELRAREYALMGAAASAPQSSTGQPMRAAVPSGAPAQAHGTNG